MSSQPRSGDETQRRRALAERIARECPATFATEIAVSGSTAIGMADGYSDLELNFWIDVIPPAGVRATWLDSLRATDVAVDVEASRDGTLWTTWRQDGVWVEGGWQTLAAHERTIDLLRRAETIDHDLHVVASSVVHAVPLRTLGRLADWRHALASYPDALAEALIATTVERWKWLKPASRTLRVRPDGLVERIETIFTAADAATSLRLCLELVVDVLALAPPRDAVDRAQSTIRDALARHDSGAAPTGRLPHQEFSGRRLGNLTSQDT